MVVALCCRALVSPVQLRWRLLRRLAPLAAVPAAFVAFLLVNGGVVIGDHSMHEPVLHLVHPLHFVLFAAVALAPAAFSPSRFDCVCPEGCIFMFTICISVRMCLMRLLPSCCLQSHMQRTWKHFNNYPCTWQVQAGSQVSDGKPQPVHHGHLPFRSRPGPDHGPLHHHPLLHSHHWLQVHLWTAIRPFQ
jgi:DIE2/ALG10 family